MIVVDASALLAVLFEEPEGVGFTTKIVGNPAIMSPVNFWEALVRAHAVDNMKGRAAVEALITALGVEIVPTDAEVARLAADAFARFGRRTPAGLNLGDCFAYVLAKQRNAPLLFKGDDFTKTDVALA